MPPIIESIELVQVLAEAEDIARSVNQKLTTAHQLLAFFTVPNKAELLLRDRGIDEDKVLGAMTGRPSEPDGTERDLRDRAREVANGLGADEVDCLHLLIAMGRVRTSSAHQLLGACGLSMATLRNVAFSYFTSRMPRRLRQIATQPVRATPSAAPSASSAVPRSDSHSPAPVEGRPNGSTRSSTGPTLPPARPSPSLLHPPPQPTSGGGVQPECFGTEAERVRAPAQQQPASPYRIDPEAFPWLATLARNLTELAAQDRLDPLVGREREIEEALDVLGKRRANNPLLIGEPGVGKTAIVEGIAQRLLSERADPRIVLEIDMASVLAGTQLRGSFSEKLNGIKDEVRRSAGRFVVFIDEIHTVMGAGATGEGPQDAANELKAALARGEFPCIGATTHDEYRQHLEKDPALERRFTPILVREPTVPDTVRILAGLVRRYEDHHRVTFTADALEAAASLSSRYIKDRFLPDKAIAVLDLAGSRARRERLTTADVALVARVVARLAGIPESRLVASDRQRVLGISKALSDRIVGHRGAIERVAAVLRRNFAGFATRRPMGSFLFLGPTGVGKTELARAVAEALYDDGDALVRIDMSECSESTGVARLIGAPPGYVGYGDGGQLTDAVRRRPSSVIVLDEVEKAHRDVLMILLQVLEEGRLTDGRGRQADFSGSVIILTSNLGGAEATRSASGVVGFSAAAAPDSTEQRAIAAARAALPPELWNRLDETLYFEPLRRDDLRSIASKMLSESAKRLFEEKKIKVIAADGVAEHLVDHGGCDATLGARPLRAAVQRLVEAPLADRILSGEFVPGTCVRVAFVDGELRFAAS